KPIQCWIPQEFTRGWEEYAENYCWVASTYFSPLDKRLPTTADRSANLIVYYQWAPILMAIQALLFYLPCLIWRLFYCHSGFNVRRIMQMANDSNILLPEHGLKNVRFIARYMESCIYRQRDYKNRDGCRNDKSARSGLVSTNFPYHSSYRMGLQQFPVSAAGTETQLLGTSERPDHGLPPPQYYKSTTEGGTPEPRAPPSRSSHRRRVMRSNGEATGCLSLSRRHKQRHSLCERLKFGFRSGSRSTLLGKQARKSQLNPITGSPGLAGVLSVSCDLGDPASGIGKSSDSKGCFKKSHSKAWCCGKRSGNFLVVLYFFVKVLYLINIIGQLVLMEKFIATNHAFYGIRVLLDLIQGTQWYTSGNFPRVTFCDFEAKKLGKNQR
ncbi:unnamed protein product, partial [Dibothriocephalus latus]